MVDYQAILSIPTVLLACCSLLASICVCISIEKTGYTPCQCKGNKKNDKFNQFLPTTKNNGSQPVTMMNIIVYWMCIVDGCHMIPIIMNWIPQILSKYNNNWFWDETECTIIGVAAQFCCIQSPLWHILLAYHLGYLLCGGKLQTIHKQRKCHYTLVILLPLLASIAPFLMPAHDGYEENDLAHDKDCWVVGASQYIFIAAIATSLMFHYCVLLIAVIQFKKYKAFIAFSFQYYQIVIKLSRFVIVYTIIRFFPLIERIWEAIGGVPYWLVLFQHLSIAILGMGNAVVWFWNQRNDAQFYNRYTRNLKIYQKRNIIGADFKVNVRIPSTLNSTSEHNKNVNFGDTTDSAEESLSNTTFVKLSTFVKITAL